jgi:hypothetical protein
MKNSENFEKDVQNESNGGLYWLLANRIEGSHKMANSHIQGSIGVKPDALGKATAVGCS